MVIRELVVSSLSIGLLLIGAAISQPVIAYQATATDKPTQSEASDDSAKAAGDETSRIIEIGKTDNRVQQHLDYLTNRIGPRLSGSEGLQAACEWARDEFKSMGLKSRLEEWGEFEVGFERGPATGMMVSPKKMNLEFGTNAWSAGTKGRILRKAVMAPKTLEQLEEMREELKGSFVLIEPTPRRSRRRRQPAPRDAEKDKKTDERKTNPNLLRDNSVKS